MERTAYTYHWYIEQFNQAMERAERLADNTDTALLTRKPGPDTWSVAECLNHLIQFGNIYHENINRGIETAMSGSVNSAQQFPPRLIWKGVIKLFEPPYRLKMKTVNSFVPADVKNQDVNFEETLTNFLELQERFINQLERCRQKCINLRSEKVRNPVLEFIKMTLSESFAVTEAHQRRHLWQARQVIKTLRKQQK